MELHRIWHCPRPELARAYLRLLGSGLAVSTTIFAPRRTGKTVFLMQDLGPAAASAGYAVAYADLWQTRTNPGVALIRALEEAQQPKTAGQRMLRRLKTPVRRRAAPKSDQPPRGAASAASVGAPVRKLKAGGSVSGITAEFELEFAEPRKHATEMALRLDELVAQLSAKKPLLILLDEAQELARTADNELMATALRTAMTKHRDRLRVVFTGSSRSRLAHVFSDANARLYSVGASVQDFPLLGRELVEFAAMKFEAASGRTLDVAHAWREFQGFDQRPEPFLQAVVAMLMDPALGMAQACKREREAAARKETYAAQWSALDPLQQHLLMLALHDPALTPFAKGTMEPLARAVGMKTLTPSRLQHAFKVLADRSILVKTARGVYAFDDPTFERWLRDAKPAAVRKRR